MRVGEAGKPESALPKQLMHLRQYGLHHRTVPFRKSLFIVNIHNNDLTNNPSVFGVDQNHLDKILQVNFCEKVQVERLFMP